MITEHSVIQKSRELLMSIVDNEAVILGINHGKYIGLNEIGTEILNKLAEPVRVNDLIKEFTELYDEDEVIIQEHILEFLKDLYDRSLIQCLDENSLQKL